MKFAIVDIQGYVINNEFTVKELAIYDGKDLKSYLFKPTVQYSDLYTSDRKTANYLYHNIHGIPYNAGVVDYSEINDILENDLSSVDTVFVKGQAKADFLASAFMGWVHIVNLEKDTTNQVPNLEPTTENHDSSSSSDQESSEDDEESSDDSSSSSSSSSSISPTKNIAHFHSVGIWVKIN
ncbi:hypothetical protein ABEB36_015867 [Hypothenemus hampei]|uniref:Uncharacterized protein n=1 Tax=Hypothenemus hampei TaxID=57062 RepID=A0ABD1DYI3_HYPHA